MSTITERVAAGAAFLDQHDPEWWRADVERAIDLDRLNLGYSDTCVLGQRCPLGLRGGNYSEYQAFAAKLIGAQPYEEPEINAWAAPLGFQAQLGRPIGEEMADYRALTAEWKRVITERRAAA